MPLRDAIKNKLFEIAKERATGALINAAQKQFPSHVNKISDFAALVNQHAAVAVDNRFSQMAINALTEVARASPVKTGRFAASWEISTDGRVSIGTNNMGGSFASIVRARATAHALPAGITEIHILNSQPYYPKLYRGAGGRQPGWPAAAAQRGIGR